ncbi:MAG: hemerythrin domain-containing protein [Elusimicrobiota bacterium]
MSVLQDLSSEHAAFTRLIERLEASAAADEMTARRDIRPTILILLSALDVHEEIEDAVFGDSSYAASKDAKLIIDRVERQHQTIADLRLAILAAIGSSDAVGIQRLKSLVSRIASALRSHFKTEEELLWPHYEKFYGSLDESRRRRIEERIKAVETDIAVNGAAISRNIEARKHAPSRPNLARLPSAELW